MNIATSLIINANRHPEKQALICEGRSYTYQELNDEVNRIANGLLSMNYEKGDKIALFMKNSDHFIIGFYAIMKAGMVAVPINFRFTASEASYIVLQSDSVAVFCDEEFEETILSVQENAPKLKDVFISQNANNFSHVSWESLRSSDATEPKVNVKSTDDAEILYTSGTTGKPKGALFDHQRIINVSMKVIMGTELNKNDTLIHLAPMFHSAQLNLFLTTSIMLGTKNVVHRNFNPSDVLQAIEDYEVSYFFGVPAMYNALSQYTENNKYNLSSVKKCMYGAAPMAPGLIKQSMELFGTDQFYSLCGLTEAGPGGVYLQPDEHKTKLGAGGKALYLTNVRVVDEKMNDVEAGETGEFAIKGMTVMKEYYKKPEETAETFKDGWLLTGDLAVIDEEGYITIVDRKKDMIISGGENVYSVEVEQVLNSHPDIIEAAAIGIPNDKWGEEVMAVLVVNEGTTIDEESVKNYCRKHLAGYKVPRKFSYQKELPRNASGKILKYKLRESVQNENVK